MTHRKIIFIDQTAPVLWERLQKRGYECLDYSEMDRVSLLGQVADCFGLVIRSRIKLDEDFLSHAKNLRFIARSGVGLEHIDLAYAEAQGIQVLPSPEGSRDTVGEHTIGLLLSLLNNLARADHQVRNGQWIREGNRGVELKGKTVGIIGYGNMGTAFAQRLQGFEVKVLAYDKFKSDYGDQYAEAVDLAKLQQEADIISLHIPFLPENRHFVNAAFLDAFRKPIFLVNTARGLVLHTADLVDALQSGKVLGAALDVLEYEEMSFSHLDLHNLPAPFQHLKTAGNVVLSPHIAGWSFESEPGHARALADKIERIFG
ncbi:MAG: NAD(P)-dependent oxidoreductase [Saprospiraceae bacterium]